MDKALLDEMIEKKYVNVQKLDTGDPTTDLWLLNYSKSCQLEHIWNEVTIQCRGLIINMFGTIKARPFVKFYNYEELDGLGITVPNLPFDAYEKMDGSLGIMYWVNDVPYLATRGSFTSDQCKHGTEILHTKYKDMWNRFDKTKTYLFEIIYPEDKHCIVYGPEVDDIFLLAVIDTETGLETDSIDNYRDVLSVTKHYDGIKDWKNIREQFDGANREGFVIRFSNGFRMKLKYEQYFKIHFLRSMLSKKLILEHIEEGSLCELDKMIKELDEENQIYYNKMKQDILDRYSEIENKMLSIYRPSSEFASQKDYAAWVLTNKGYSGMIFQKDKGNDYSPIIWKIIKNEIREENRLSNLNSEDDE
jgi:RNA ligase